MVEEIKKRGETSNEKSYIKNQANNQNLHKIINCLF
jgi:hypothetical protein